MDEPERTPKFELTQARELAKALAEHGADYLFLGKAGAILLGYPGTTLDLDLFAPRDAENARRCIAALRDLDFHIDPETEQALLCPDCCSHVPMMTHEDDAKVMFSTFSA